MLLMCWNNTLQNFHRFGVVSRRTMGHFFLRCGHLRYHVQYQHHQQQKLHKHTKAEAVVNNTATIKQQNNHKSNNNMKTPSSSVLSPYNKEESLTKMRLKHSQQQLPPHKTENSVIGTAANSTTIGHSVNIPYNIDWVFKGLKNPNRLWLIFSQLAVFTVGIFSKIVLGNSN